MDKGKKFSVSSTTTVDDYQCSACNKKTTCLSISKITKIGQYLVCAYPRRDEFGTIMNYVSHCPSRFKF